MNCEETDCTQPVAHRTVSDHRFCLGHAIANLRNHADGLERTLANSPDWEHGDCGHDDGRGVTMADRMRFSIAELRASADKLAAR